MNVSILNYKSAVRLTTRLVRMLVYSMSLASAPYAPADCVESHRTVRSEMTFQEVRSGNVIAILLKGPDEPPIYGSATVLLYGEEDSTRVFLAGTVFDRGSGPLRIWLEDLTEDGQAELIVTGSDGMGAFATLDVFQYVERKLERLDIPMFENDDPLFDGYGGGDTLEVADGVIRRSFPVYKDGDSMSSPSDGLLKCRLLMRDRRWAREP